MPYQRGLDDEQGRWIPKHSPFWEMVGDLRLGRTCDCCTYQFRRRLYPDPVIEDRLDVRQRRWDWLNKTRPGLMRLEGKRIGAWCARTGKDDADWWWKSMLKKHSPR